MADFTIEAQPRDVRGKKVKRLRKVGMVPISVYGAKIDPLVLQVPYRPLEIALMKAGGTNLIDLTVEGKTHVVLARDVQRHVLLGTIEHVDFFAVDQSQKIRADIQIHLIGESPMVVSRQGILLTGTNTLTIEVLPSKLINEIEIDLTPLVEIGQSIHVSDLDLDDEIDIINDPEEMIVRISQPSAARAAILEGEEGEEGEEEIEEGAEPEVIAKGKDEEEDDEE